MISIKTLKTMMSFVDKTRFSNAQTAARVFILSYKHIGMVSLSYFENQILALESLLLLCYVRLT